MKYTVQNMKYRMAQYLPRLLYNVSQYTNSFIIAKILKTDAIDFKDHVSRLNTTIQWHGPTAHQQCVIYTQPCQQQQQL